MFLTVQGVGLGTKSRNRVITALDVPDDTDLRRCVKKADDPKFRSWIQLETRETLIPNPSPRGRREFGGLS
jgi:hypothetical protein